MARTTKPTIDSVLTELTTINQHIAQYAEARAAEAVSSVEATAEDLGAMVCGLVRNNAFTCIAGAIALGLAAAVYRKVA